MTLEDYQKTINKTSQKTYENQVSQINQKSNQEKQDAYVMQKRLEKYLGQGNAANGIQGLTSTDRVNVANNFANNIGEINTRKNVDLNTAYQNLLTTQQGAKDTVFGMKYQEQLNEKANAEARAAGQSSRVLDLAITSAEKLFTDMLNDIGQSEELDTEQAMTQIMEQINSQYSDMSAEDASYLQQYIQTMLTGKQYGSQALDSFQMEGYETDYTKRADKYAYQQGGQVYELDFTQDGYKSDGIRGGTKEDVAEMVAFALQNGRLPDTSEIERGTGANTWVAKQNILSDIKTFLQKNNIDLG